MKWVVRGSPEVQVKLVRCDKRIDVIASLLSGKSVTIGYIDSDGWNRTQMTSELAKEFGFVLDEENRIKKV